MLPKDHQPTPSPYAALYDLLIPKNHLLRRITELVDFSFIMDELSSAYSATKGRTAIPPIRMFKYLILKALYNLSDADLVERSRYDMSFKFFLGMAPEEDVIHSTSLTTFRRLRMDEETFEPLLDRIIGTTVGVAKDQGLLTDDTIIVDATHTRSRFQRKAPILVLQEKAKKLRKVIRTIDPTIEDTLPKRRQTKKKPTLQEEMAYVNELTDAVKKNAKLMVNEIVKTTVHLTEEVVEDCAHTTSFSHDEEARVGYKSPEDSFYGYKTSLAMTTNFLITSAIISSGEQADGNFFQALVEKTERAGMTVKNIIGDTAYSGLGNLRFVGATERHLFARLHPIISNGESKNENFTYIKDADRFVCKGGHISKKGQLKQRAVAGRSTQIRYYFDTNKCRQCPFKDGCYSDTATKSHSYSIPTEYHLEQRAFENTQVFKEKSKERYKIEAKNGELKNRHGYDEAITTGLLGMQIQAATTIFAVNMKRIVKLLEEKEA